MKLSVKARLLILQVLPDESNITTMRIVRDLRRNLGFSEAESEALAFRNGEDWSQGCPQCGEQEPERLFSRHDDDYGVRMATCLSCKHQGMAGANQIGWNQNADENADIEIGDVAKKIIREQFEKLDREGKIKPDHLDICEMFGL